MKVCRYFSLILIGVLMCACSSPERKLLARADSVMEENPDSALAILEQLDRRSLDKSELPYYALLMTQALVKTDVPVDSDTLISLAYRKYADYRRGDRGIRSSFYMGEVFFNQEKSREAMKHYLKAYEEAKRLDNHYWRAKSAERIADLFFLAFNYDEASRYRKEAIEHYGLADRIANQRYAIADLATDYNNDSKYNEAINIIDSITIVCYMENEKDSFLLDYIERPKIDALVTLKRVTELTDDDIRILDREISEGFTLDANILKLKIKEIVKDNNIDYNLVNTLISSANSIEDKGRVLYALYEYAKSINNINILTETMDSLLIYQNSVAVQIIKESVTGAERDFYEELAQRNKQKSQIYLYIIIAIIFITIIIAFIAYRFITLRNKAHRAQLEANVEAIISLRAYSAQIAAEKNLLNSEMKEKEQEFNNLANKVDEQQMMIENERQKHLNLMSENINIMDSLFRKKWGTLNLLCEEYYEKGASPKIGNLILRKIESEIRTIGSKDGLRQIEEEVNRYKDGIAGKLRRECASLKELDINICVLKFAGFSVKAICFILNMQSNNYYVRKARLITKIKQSDAPCKDLFLANLE